MPDFNAVLDKKIEDTEKPKPRPIGTYLAAVAGLPTTRTFEAQGVERTVVDFKLKVIAPVQVDDTEALAEQAIETWAPLIWTLWPDTPEGEYAFKETLANVLDIDIAGKSYREALAEAPGRQVNVKLKHRPYTDKRTGQPEIATDVETVTKA